MPAANTPIGLPSTPSTGPFDVSGLMRTIPCLHDPMMRYEEVVTRLNPPYDLYLRYSCGVCGVRIGRHEAGVAGTEHPETHLPRKPLWDSPCGTTPWDNYWDNWYKST